MTNFEKSCKKTLNFEGDYSNDFADAGGETFKGISRVFFPQWPGWKIIDSAKSSSDFPKNLNSDEDLQQMIRDFYKKNFWDTIRLDEIDSQNIAEELFDTGVNMGINRAKKFLQQALNFLNKNEELYDDLGEDGIIGERTLDALDIILKRGEEALLYKILNVLQANHYLTYMMKSPTQEKFARGWFSRVEFLK
jgi:lysozyme family protein